MEYLFLEGNKNLKSYKTVEILKNINTFSTSNSRAEDKNLEYLQNIENVYLGDSYQKKSVENFAKTFNGKNLWIYGKEIKGQRENYNPFSI